MKRNHLIYRVLSQRMKERKERVEMNNSQRKENYGAYEKCFLGKQKRKMGLGLVIVGGGFPGIGLRALL